MLKEEDRIFKNLYNELGWKLEDSLKRDDWSDTKNLIAKGREWIIFAHNASACHLASIPVACVGGVD